MYKRLSIVALLAVALIVAPAAAAPSPTPGDAALQFMTNLPDGFRSIAPAALKTRLDAGEKPFLLDVREPNETAAGVIAGAVVIPIRSLAANMGKIPTVKEAEIIAICQSGLRSSYVAMALVMNGYTNARTMSLGMREWYAQNWPVVK